MFLCVGLFYHYLFFLYQWFVLIGIAWIKVRFYPTVDNHLTDTLIGISLVLLSAIFWALFIIYSKRAVSNISSTIFTSIYMCITTVLLLLGFIIDSKNFTTFPTLQTHTMIYLVFLAIFCSIIPHTWCLLVLKEWMHLL